MIDWSAVLRRHHAQTQAESGFGIILGPPTDASKLDRITREVKLPLPVEMSELYQQVDGYGLQLDDDSSLSPWFVVPTELLTGFVESSRDVFCRTHQSLADRFLPFIDWANGDSMGYIYDREGSLVDGLHMFDHERYGYDDPDQSPSDFFRTFDGSLADFLDVDG